VCARACVHVQGGVIDLLTLFNLVFLGRGQKAKTEMYGGKHLQGLISSLVLSFYVIYK